MTPIINASPQYRLLGGQDLSGRPPVYDPIALPTHLPHVFLYTERGPSTPQLVAGAARTRMYGAKSFDYSEAYANHQTVLANVFNEYGNLAIVQRIKPAVGAATASIRLSLDLLPTDVPVYERNTDGTYRLDQAGLPIPTGDTTPGYIGKWVAGVVTGDVGSAEVVAGSQTNGGEQSQLYPMFDIPMSSFGKWGDLSGIRFYCATARSSIPVDEDLVEAQRTNLYRLQSVLKPSVDSLPNINETQSGGQYLEFSLMEGAINPRLETDLFVDELFPTAWNDEDAVTPVYGDIGQFFVYHQNVDTILDMLFASEDVFDQWEDGDKHMINLLSGVDYLGRPHYSYVVEGPSNGGLLFTSGTTHYATGGSDGVMNDEDFAERVGNECENYGELENKFLDEAMWPQSAIWDSGFPLETKKKLFVPMGVRKDIITIVGTQEANKPLNTTAEESSVAIALRTAAAMFPESEYYGTGVCRAAVVGHGGRMLNTKFKGNLPLTIDLAAKVAEFMGASNGVWKADKAFDVSPANIVTRFNVNTVNSTYKSTSIRNKDWANGLVWVASYDRRSLFYPGIQTVYSDDTSILNSLITAFALAELEKVCQRTWRDLTGDSSLTVRQFIDKSNRLIEQRAAASRFANRFIIEPDTFMTDADEQRGYSWSCKVNLYGNNMRTVGTYTIVARRLEDYEG
ncbi:MAG: hypothetical protein CL678_15895 [Bdellovibrionaceae bacterium]|nr:hypothetical protein [Pseudobdellovibrionaceae bacterium]